MNRLGKLVREWWLLLFIAAILIYGYFSSRLPSDNVSIDEFQARITAGRPVIVEIMQNG